MVNGNGKLVIVQSRQAFDISAFLFFLSFPFQWAAISAAALATSITGQKTSTSYVRLLCTTLHVYIGGGWRG